MQTKTNAHYANKFNGKYVQCIVPFPDFEEDLYPLVLIKEWEYVVIFNIQSKKYTKVTDIDTTGEHRSVSAHRLCFLDKENDEYAFITHH